MNITNIINIYTNIYTYIKKNTYTYINKKRMNITDFINIYTDIYTYIKCDKNDSKQIVEMVATTYLAIRTKQLKYF